MKNRIMMPPYKLNPYAPLNQGLVAKYISLPGMSGGAYAYDLCGKNKGTLTNMTAGYGWVGPNGRPGGWGALRFDGTDDYVNIGIDLFGGLTKATVSMWFLATSFGAIVNYISRYISDYYTIFGPGSAALNSERLNFGIATGSGANAIATGTTVLVANTWYHAVAVFDGTQTGNANRLKLYLNGTQDTVAKFDATIPASVYSQSGASVGFGDDSTAANKSLYKRANGYLDDISIYNRALSSTEVAALYNASKNQYRDEIISGYIT